MVQEAGWVLVYGVAQEVEADIVLGLLQEEGIPALKRYPGAGGFLKLAYGLTSGVDIYVPASEAARAGRLLAGGIEENGLPEDGLGEKGTSKSGTSKSGAPKSGVPKSGAAESGLAASIPPASEAAGRRDGRWKWAILGMVAFLALILLIYRNGFLW
ncbi:hypothetical protein CEB3_c49130 [Peptococcaceae bacterium CEB3]|nr:hypothetical protein CEB3_c49130 [Peptococcaceae bacterium CEB3]